MIDPFKVVNINVFRTNAATIKKNIFISTSATKGVFEFKNASNYRNDN